MRYVFSCNADLYRRGNETRYYKLNPGLGFSNFDPGLKVSNFQIQPRYSTGSNHMQKTDYQMKN